jgi:predicted transcriptional regulator
MIVIHNKALVVDGASTLKVVQALSSETRLQILNLVSQRTMSVSGLTEAMGMPHSTVNFNLKQLEDAELVSVHYQPGTRGQLKMISKRYDDIYLKIPGLEIESATDTIEISMPIGHFSLFAIKPVCGMASDTKSIGIVDDPKSFYEPERVTAQILWFKQGFVEYNFPNKLPAGAEPFEVEISLEVCSEAPGYAMDWPSDITLWLNNVEVGTWTSPGDLGGERGRHSPSWWAVEQTQYGLLKRWLVTANGAFIDGEKLSDVSVKELGINDSDHIVMRIGVKEDARNVGGMNLFGRKFGNYEQDIVLRTRHIFKDNGKSLKAK